MAQLPRGTFTFLFTDIEGSTALVERLGRRYPALLAAHREDLHLIFKRHGGRVVEMQGDGCFCVITDVASAVRAAIEIQTVVSVKTSGAADAIRVRIGMHVGEAEIVDTGYVGVDVHRAARIAEAAHGGQIVVSSRVAQGLGGATSLRDLGLYRLKGLAHHERLFQVVVSGAKADFPPLRTQAATVHLPKLSTSFVGREFECVDITALLERSSHRLVTLTGPGGTGKTRLAVSVAASLGHAFSEIVFVSLAEVREPALVPSAIGRGLQVQDTGDRPIEDVVRSHVQEHAVLLILDNFEHLLPASPFVAGLLDEAGSTKILVTSRAALRISGEYTYEVPPMAVPTCEDEDLGQIDAVTLFVQRAQEAHRGFRLNPGDIKHVANICVALDGLPLAIELAASRIRVLSTAQLAARLQRRLPLLTGGAASLPARQRTLRDTIAWSTLLLGVEAQRTFRQVSVFEGGFSIEAAEAVTEPDGSNADSARALEGVTALIDNSLLWRETLPDGTGRLRMLQTIREFARDELDRHGETADVSRFHACYYLRIALDSRKALDTDEQLDALAVLDREHDNILTALERLLDPGDPALDDALRMVDAMGWYWYTRGHVGVATAWLERTLEAAATAPPQLRAKPHYWLAACMDRQGHLAQARALMSTSVALLHQAGDIAAMATALNGLATVAEHQGDLDDAAATYRKSIELYRKLGNDWGMATVYMGLGSLALRTREIERASVLLERAQRLFAEQGDVWSQATTRIDLARVRLQQGRTVDAEMLIDCATSQLRNWGEKGHLATCLDLYACVAAARRLALLAGRLAGAADATRHSLGQPLDTHLVEEFNHLLQPARTAKAAEFDTGRRQGRRMTLDQALQLAKLRATVQGDADITLPPSATAGRT